MSSSTLGRSSSPPLPAAGQAIVMDPLSILVSLRIIGVGAPAIVGVFGLRIIVSATQDPGYQMPWGATAAKHIGRRESLANSVRL